MSDTKTATPTPWEVSKNGNIIESAKKGSQCLIAKFSRSTCPKRTAENEANAALIVQCVNSHQELVECVGEALDYIAHKHNMGTGVRSAKRLLLMRKLAQTLDSAKGEQP